MNLDLSTQSKLYENRVNIVVELYGKIADLHQKMKDLTMIFRMVPSDKELMEKQENQRIENAVKSYNDFLGFYLKNKIYMSEPTCEKIDDIQKKYHGVFMDYTFFKTYGKYYDPESAKKIHEMPKTMTEEIEPILSRIESDCRSMLGVK